MTTIKKCSALLLAMLLAAALPGAALADDWYLAPGGYYTVNLIDGSTLFTYAGQISVDDEYISSDNKRYRVVSVDDANRTAVAQYVEDVVLWEDFDAAMLQNVSSEQAQKKVGIYCSHTDESYIPGDGAEAKPEKGGILDVANMLAEELNKRGVKAVADNTSHVPHDAGAYRRSRSSAMNLLESLQPNLLLDIHRDGVPNAEEYKESIGGKQVSKCRFVLGRSNQNVKANENTARKLKKIADSMHPGLVKDIYIGRGSYNQDLTPNSMIVELGTHTLDKKHVLKSTGYLADVIAKYLGVSGAAGQSQGGEPQIQQEAQKSPSANRSAATAIAWTLGIVGAACLLFLLVATVNGERRRRVGNFFREITGIGRHRDKEK